MNLQELAVVSTKESIRASYSQEQIWYASQMSDDSNIAYNIPRAIRISGSLDISALTQSINTLIQRHSALRTVFFQTDNGLFQKIKDHKSIELAIRDISGQDRGEQKQVLDTILKAESEFCFDLERGPLYRYLLVKISGTHYVLHSNIHHMVFDGTSANIYFHEFSTLYSQLSEGRQPVLPALTFQYIDYVHWKRSTDQNDNIQEFEQYWLNKLCNSPDLLNLPSDHARPDNKSYKGGIVYFSLPGCLHKKLSMIAKSATLNMSLLSVFYILMYRYTGQLDVVVGSPFASRKSESIKGVIGCFVNMLALRVELQPDDNFLDILEKTKKTTFEAYVNSDIPFQRVVDLVKPRRAINYASLFQVVFVLQNTNERIALTDLEAEQIKLPIERSPFDLTVELIETEDTLEGKIVYSSDLFEKHTVIRLINNYQRLLESIIDNPEQSISELTLLATTERVMLDNWASNTIGELNEKRCIHKIVEEQVSRLPNELAVVSNAEQLTYLELNNKANQLARYLQEQKQYCPGHTMALYMTQSIDMVVAMLAILKTNGNYLPLDPDYPNSRVSQLINDAGVDIIITQRVLLDRLLFCEKTVISLDDPVDQKKIQSASTANLENLPVEINLEQLAYINYTSGSTGKPKGVMITHSNVVSLIDDSNTLNISPSDIVAQGANYTFDAVTFEIWGTLLNGAKLVILSKDVMLDATKLHTVINELEITTLFLTTALFNRIADENPTCFSALNKLMFGGEKYSADAIRAVLLGNDSLSLYHMYGPTECTTYTTSYKFNKEKFLTDSLAPIGRPLRHNDVYVLDKNMTPVPILVTGELYIGGKGVAKGYLNQDQLTQEKFINNPFTERASKRLYKTGDQVRWLSDGNLEFISRIDDQVKIRGFRVELGEIESHLAALDFIKESVVSTYKDGSNNRYLIAYIVLLDPIDSTESDLNNDYRVNVISDIKDTLYAALPTFMVPSVFKFMDQLPLNANAKVDRSNLPSPVEDDLHVGEYVAPSTDIEVKVSDIWQKILKIEKVSVNEDFFDLGGNSLMVTTCINEIRHEFGIDIPLESFYDDSSVRHISAILVSSKNQGDQLLIPELVPVNSHDTDEVMEEGEF